MGNSNSNTLMGLLGLEENAKVEHGPGAVDPRATAEPPPDGQPPTEAEARTDSVNKTRTDISRRRASRTLFTSGGGLSSQQSQTPIASTSLLGF